VNGWDADGQHWFRQPGQPPAAGRPGIPGFEPGGLIGTIVDDYVPAGYTFATAHDWLVGSLTVNGPIMKPVSDAIVNIPTMPVVYAAAVVAETILPEFLVGWFVDNQITEDPPVSTTEQEDEGEDSE